MRMNTPGNLSLVRAFPSCAIVIQNMFAQVNVVTVRRYVEHSSNINPNPAHLAQENSCFSIDFGNEVKCKILRNAGFVCTGMVSSPLIFLIIIIKFNSQNSHLRFITLKQ